MVKAPNFEVYAVRYATRGARKEASPPPPEGLEALDIDCARVPYVVLTHLHYDHVGNLEDFPAATFVVQEDERRSGPAVTPVKSSSVP